MTGLKISMIELQEVFSMVMSKQMLEEYKRMKTTTLDEQVLFLCKNNKYKGIVDLNDYEVEFIYKFGSNFLFLFVNSKYEKRKSFNILYEISNNELTYFKPDPYKEHEMICSSKDNIIKFIHDNKIVNSKKLTRLYCEMNLSDDYYLYESKITFEIGENRYAFLYYGDAIKIKSKDEKYIKEVISFFEKEMGE